MVLIALLIWLLLITINLLLWCYFHSNWFDLIFGKMYLKMYDSHKCTDNGKFSYHGIHKRKGLELWVFNATFNNILAISWRSDSSLVIFFIIFFSLKQPVLITLNCEFQYRSWRGVLDTTLCDKVCQWLVGQVDCVLWVLQWWIWPSRYS
jgi:hypothetical protein